MENTPSIEQLKNPVQPLEGGYGSSTPIERTETLTEQSTSLNPDNTADKRTLITGDNIVTPELGALPTHSQKNWDGHGYPLPENQVGTGEKTPADLVRDKANGVGI